MMVKMVDNMGFWLVNQMEVDNFKRPRYTWVKGKAVPLQAWHGQEGSRKLR